MAKKESLQHKLDRVRAPRVQITYDVEIGDAIEMKEIPFVLGVLADLSGSLMNHFRSSKTGNSWKSTGTISITCSRG